MRSTWPERTGSTTRGTGAPARIPQRPRRPGHRIHPRTHLLAATRAGAGRHRRRHPARGHVRAGHDRGARAAAARHVDAEGDAQRQRRPGRAAARLRLRAETAVRHPGRRRCAASAPAWATSAWSRTCSASVDKGETRSDWLRRPLSAQRSSTTPPTTCATCSRCTTGSTRVPHRSAAANGCARTARARSMPPTPAGIPGRTSRYAPRIPRCRRAAPPAGWLLRWRGRRRATATARATGSSTANWRCCWRRPLPPTPRR